MQKNHWQTEQVQIVQKLVSKMQQDIDKLEQEQNQNTVVLDHFLSDLK